MLDLNLSSVSTVRYYPYRTARVLDWFARLDYLEAKDEVRRADWKVIRELKQRASAVHHDEDSGNENHLVFVLTYMTGESIAVWFTDFSVLLGKQVTEGRW